MIDNKKEQERDELHRAIWALSKRAVIFGTQQAAEKH